ncbi:MAG: 30S ribosomal protein S7 [Candidatus Schekmanbacteria bacterium RIFCSPHIGHO2_02_FULL_38_11]|uniref:Small ribosomal subunit protein uS7 n=1 Tax=Candidatus Schekmanbacteria bacterium RIFCSPLOWO2_12_FULL_38_15 TaxID=1817883 RepID=A0A1F7SCV4_9BACT|nr:MAG: 30S ribosomal protein S7 [Candidatus Schekmanbacteria bacterium RIFCSPLOWO2_02_FULL_38_14]OGL51201.1 MAG: 30S ribosomal protein S7 [Candidatus Schekmanbacteria bacterium RIFCSPHIGHO2_02_FULL_38_11]OGL51610.1 MAG: 30S ribosomal protein S7 [Candidatus Schekmanbacteria bacterium RIFCSPLOWO2_12_FULL_38_15]
MPRKKLFKKRVISSDLKYNSVLIQRFINGIMKNGKKRLAEKVFYDAIDIMEEKTKLKEPINLFQKAIENVRPSLEVKSRRVGGSTYQIPIEVPSDRRVSLAIRWIIGFAKKRKGGDMQHKLADELIDAANNTGSAVKKKIDTHKMAEANKAFAHYKW